MTVKELKEMLNDIDKEYEDLPIVVFDNDKRIETEYIRRVCSFSGKPCCVQLKLKK